MHWFLKDENPDIYVFLPNSVLLPLCRSYHMFLIYPLFPCGNPVLKVISQEYRLHCEIMLESELQCSLLRVTVISLLLVFITRYRFTG